MSVGLGRWGRRALSTTAQPRVPRHQAIQTFRQYTVNQSVGRSTLFGLPLVRLPRGNLASRSNIRHSGELPNSLDEILEPSGRG